jgi:hypothetical protein
MGHARNELQAAVVNGKIYAIGGGYIEPSGPPRDVNLRQVSLAGS